MNEWEKEKTAVEMEGNYETNELGKAGVDVWWTVIQYSARHVASLPPFYAHRGQLKESYNFHLAVPLMTQRRRPKKEEKHIYFREDCVFNVFLTVVIKVMKHHNYVLFYNSAVCVLLQQYVCERLYQPYWKSDSETAHFADNKWKFELAKIRTSQSSLVMKASIDREVI